jgi:hypothetical protein
MLMPLYEKKRAANLPLQYKLNKWATRTCHTLAMDIRIKWHCEEMERLWSMTGRHEAFDSVGTITSLLYPYQRL